MPSPIAHSALLLAVVPPLRPALRDLSSARRRAFYAAVAFALLAPDLDIALGMVLGPSPFALHGGPMHSFLLAPLFGLGWAAAVRGLILRGGPPDGRWALSWAGLWVLGTAAFASHVLLDWLTPGRGVGMFWPINADRVGSPISLFVGVEHSDWRNWRHHGLTLATEATFAVVMAAIGWALVRWCRRSPIAAPRPVETAA